LLDLINISQVSYSEFRIAKSDISHKCTFEHCDQPDSERHPSVLTSPVFLEDI